MYLKTRLVDSLLIFSFFQRRLGKRWVIRWNKSYTLAETELYPISKIITKDSIVFDIGANRGELSYFFAVTCRAKTVFSFEPQKRMFGVLQGVASCVQNIVPIHKALSDSVSKMNIQIPVHASGRYTQSASLESNITGRKATEVVFLETLDTFVTENNISRIDFIKCDTEGHELPVFKGGQKTLTNLRPILFIEVKDQHKTELFKLLKERGYIPYQSTEAEKAYSENYYFVPLEKKDHILRSLISQ